METFGERLRRLRKAKGWTQQRLADRIHVDRTTYNKYENDVVEPPIEVWLYLCIVLDTNPNELLGWGIKTDDMDLSPEVWTEEE